MKTLPLAMLCLSLSSFSAYAASGEYWEVTTKMDMPGMPIQMPAMTMKVCIPAGSERNPQYMQQKKDNKCQMTDIKTSGNKVTWKATCNERGETMTGTGEITHEGNSSYHGTMHLKGTTHGQAIDMTQNYSGRKVGGACDTEEQVNALKKKTDSVCDSINGNTASAIQAASMFLKGGSCQGKKDQFFASVRHDAAHDATAYEALISYEKANRAQITGACGLDLESLRVSVCKANKQGDMSFLKGNCPEEAKANLEHSRTSGGRAYTGAGRSYTGQRSTNTNPENNVPATGNANVDAVVEGAKKLKGLFGF